MTRKHITLFATLAVLAAAIVFAVRQRALGEITAGNESLRTQLESHKTSAPPKPPEPRAAAVSADSLSAEEKSELLRLRSQVPSLRNELTAASNRIAALNQPPPPPAKAPMRDTRSESLRQYMSAEPFKNAGVLARAVQKYLQEHAHQLPDDLAQVEMPGTRLPEGTIQRFELIRTGTVSDNSNAAPYLLIAREKESQQLPDGKWVRVYIQANGGATLVGPLPNRPDPDDSSFLRSMEARAESATNRQGLH